MFDKKELMRKSLINCYQKGQFTREYVVLNMTERLEKGTFSDEDFEIVIAGMDTIDNPNGKVVKTTEEQLAELTEKSEYFDKAIAELMMTTLM